MRMCLLLAWLVPGFLAGGALAQTAPHAELPSADQPVRQGATTGYTLAMSWAPEYCHGRRGQSGDEAECGARGARGFTLHGLWPDGDGPNRWPQYCHPVAILSEAQMMPALPYTPSRQLLQHEWAKHGSCTGTDPARYFAEEDRLFRGIAVPDMAALARRRDLTGDDVAAAFAARNPGLPPQAVRLNVNKRGWLEEVWLCLGRDKRPRPCPASAGGAPGGAALRIETAQGGQAGRGGYDGGYRPRYQSSYRRY